MNSTPAGPYYDAHCHYQDDRLRPWIRDRLGELPAMGIRKAVVNGTSPEDWEDVKSLASQCQTVIPSFGLHPWFVDPGNDGWLHRLEETIDERPVPIGEIGLDRWIEGYDFPAQLRAFRAQLRLAKKHGVPVTIHCLQAWGALYEQLEAESPLEAGFLLHSYGGSKEMIPAFAKLGARFSFSGYFAQPRKGKRREAFRAVPLDRLLIETDAPDMLGPSSVCRESMSDADGRKINLPSNLAWIYEYAARMFDVESSEFRDMAQANFNRLFGRWAD